MAKILSVAAKTIGAPVYWPTYAAGKAIAGSTKLAAKGTAKAFNKVVTPRNVARSVISDIGYAEMGSEAVGKAGQFVYEGAKGAFKKHQYVNEGFIGKLLENPVGYDLKMRYALPIGGLLVGYGTLDAGMQVRNKSSLGEITGARVANQVTENYSPTITDESLAEYGNTSLAKSFMNRSLSTYGAEGDIVMALHNLRRG
jgi:hypothetical protein